MTNIRNVCYSTDSTKFQVFASFPIKLGWKMRNIHVIFINSHMYYVHIIIISIIYLQFIIIHCHAVKFNNDTLGFIFYNHKANLEFIMTITVKFLFHYPTQMKLAVYISLQFHNRSLSVNWVIIHHVW